MPLPKCRAAPLHCTAHSPAAPPLLGTALSTPSVLHCTAACCSCLPPTLTMLTIMPAFVPCHARSHSHVPILHSTTVPFRFTLLCLCDGQARIMPKNCSSKRTRNDNRAAESRPKGSHSAPPFGHPQYPEYLASTIVHPEYPALSPAWGVCGPASFLAGLPYRKLDRWRRALVHPRASGHARFSASRGATNHSTLHSPGLGCMGARFLLAGLRYRKLDRWRRALVHPRPSGHARFSKPLVSANHSHASQVRFLMFLCAGAASEGAAAPESDGPAKVQTPRDVPWPYLPDSPTTFFQVLGWVHNQTQYSENNAHEQFKLRNAGGPATPATPAELTHMGVQARDWAGTLDAQYKLGDVNKAGLGKLPPGYMGGGLYVERQAEEPAQRNVPPEGSANIAVWGQVAHVVGSHPSNDRNVRVHAAQQQIQEQRHTSQLAKEQEAARQSAAARAQRDAARAARAAAGEKATRKKSHAQRMKLIRALQSERRELEAARAAL